MSTPIIALVHVSISALLLVYGQVGPWKRLVLYTHTHIHRISTLQGKLCICTEGRLFQESQSEVNRQVLTSPSGDQGLSGGSQEVLAPACLTWLLRTQGEEKLRVSLVQGSQELSVQPSAGSIKHR